MNRSNSTNLRQIEGGKTIKQGDKASLFGYELLDENNNKVDSLNGKTAEITLTNREIKTSITAEVNDGQVTFKIEKILPSGTYTVEITCDSYVFPSDHKTKIHISKSSETYQTSEMAELTKVDIKSEVIKYMTEHPVNAEGAIREYLAEHSVQAYDDKPLKDDLSALSGRVDNLSNYDDSGLRNEIKAVSERVSGLHNYDDAELRGRVTTLEEKQSSYALKSEIPQVVDLTPLTNRVTALESKPDIDFSEYAKKSEIPSGSGTVDLEPYLKTETAYSLFPTYATLQSQMTTNIKDKHLELGLDALIDEKLKNGGDPFVTQSKLPMIDTSQLASKNDLEELKRSVGSASGSGVGTVFGDNYPYDGDNIATLKNIPIGSVYVDRLRKNGALKWIKTRMYAENATRDQAKSCWKVLYGDTGNVKMPMTGSPLNGAVLIFRRINNIVELTWGGLTWGWFGIKRRGADGYVDHPSNREKFVTIIKSGNIKSGFIPTGSKLGYMMNDAGITQGTFYVSGRTDGSHVRLQFLNDVPTDRDIGDLRFTNMTYITDDPWPETL